MASSAPCLVRSRSPTPVRARQACIFQPCSSASASPTRSSRKSRRKHSGGERRTPSPRARPRSDWPRSAPSPTCPKLAIIRLANLVGRYHTGPKVGGRDFCLARQPKRKGRELDGGILTHPEMAGVSEHYFRLARQHLIRWGFLAIARPSDRAFKSKRVSHHAPSGWRCPATLYKIGAKFALALLRRAK